MNQELEELEIEGEVDEEAMSLDEYITYVNAEVNKQGDKFLREEQQAEALPTREQLLALPRAERLRVAELHAQEVTHTPYSRRIYVGNLVLEAYNNGQISTRYNDDYRLFPDEWAYQDQKKTVIHKGVEPEKREKEDEPPMSEATEKLLKQLSNKREYVPPVITDDFGMKSIVPSELTRTYVGTPEWKYTQLQRKMEREDEQEAREAMRKAILAAAVKKYQLKMAAKVLEEAEKEVKNEQ